jgi:ABC-2 type transport system ATP-binding protein
VPSTSVRPSRRDPATAPPIVDARNLVKTYGEVTALDGVSLAFAAGIVYALLGPNGAGKTTLIRVLTTLLRPDSGSVRVAGFDVLPTRRPRAPGSV